MSRVTILVVGPRMSSFLDRYVETKDIAFLDKVRAEEYRVFSLVKELQEVGNITVAVPKESSASLTSLDVSIMTYKEKLWVDEFEKFLKEFKIVIFSKDSFLGLPTFLYSKRNLIVDLWNYNKLVKKRLSKKNKFYKDFLIEPLLKEIKKRAKAVLYVADNQKFLFGEIYTLKVPFFSFDVKRKEGECILLLSDERNYYKDLAQEFKIAMSFAEVPRLVVSFDKDPLRFNWKLSQAICHGIPILGDRRNVTIKEMRRTGLAFGCDSTNLKAVEKTILKILQKKLKKKEREENGKLSSFVRRF